MSTSLSEIAGTQTARDRRLIIRAVDYWESIRGDHNYPRMIDFDIETVPDMSGQSFLIDINPKNVHMSQLKFVGELLQQDCSRELIGKAVTSVPRGSLISRLTDHFMQILANRAPMSFEAEYNDADGKVTKYRGIMMPLSNAGREIEYILGVINCRSDVFKSMPVMPMGLADAVADDEPAEECVREPAVVAEFPQRPPAVPPDGGYVTGMLDAPVEDICDLMEELRECRGAAYMVLDAQERLMRREFKMLERAYGLLHAARENPLAFAGVLEECGERLNEQDLVASILKLVLGGDYAAEDIVLYATVLRRALKDQQRPETLLSYLEGLDGGLKGVMNEDPIPFDLAGLLLPR